MPIKICSDKMTIIFTYNDDYFIVSEKNQFTLLVKFGLSEKQTRFEKKSSN